MFSLTTDSKLERMIPLALFGDEGRGPKRGRILIWSIESVLGLDDLPKDFKCKCEAGLASIPAADVRTSENEVPGSTSPEEFRKACRQSTNNKNHSFLTRHVLFGLPQLAVQTQSRFWKRTHRSHGGWPQRIIFFRGGGWWHHLVWMCSWSQGWFQTSCLSWQLEPKLQYYRVGLWESHVFILLGWRPWISLWNHWALTSMGKNIILQQTNDHVEKRCDLVSNRSNSTILYLKCQLDLCKPKTEKHCSWNNLYQRLPRKPFALVSGQRNCLDRWKQRGSCLQNTTSKPFAPRWRFCLLQAHQHNRDLTASRGHGK